MMIIPILQLQGGRCVSLERGNLAEPTIWHGDPVAKAIGFVEQGAEWLHVTDLDAVAGSGSNAELVDEIVLRAGVPVQVSGGISSDAVVGRLRDAGAGRIVFGSSAVAYPDWVKAHAKAVPDLFAISIDIWQGKVVTHGWKNEALFTPEELIHAFDGVPLAAIVITDIDRDLDLPDASFSLVTRLAEETRTPTIASGLIKSTDDVSVLRYLPNIAGVMIGRALYDKSVDLAEAIALAKPAPEPIAPFQ